MDKPFYQFEVLNEARRFDFVSVGKKEIPKTIRFRKTDKPFFFMLMLADVSPDNVLDTLTISNNGDMEIILSTVFEAITIFLEANPGAIVGFSGSNEARTRLYQIAISRELVNLNERFNVWGITSEDVETFCIGHRYQAFLISFKNVNIAQFI